MSSSTAAPARRRPRQTTFAALAAVMAVTALAGCGSGADPSSGGSDAVPERSSAVSQGGAAAAGTAGLPGGELPAGVTVFDDGYPAVANLDPALVAALRDAAQDARDDGVELYVNSGWRSAAYQGRLLEEAVAEHGSPAEAARWVATPETSPHVSGDAVDVGHSDATSWLSEHGAGYGLCQVYRNEPWHYELRPDAVDDGCPPMYRDPTHDPRMQR